MKTLIEAKTPEAADVLKAFIRATACFTPDQVVIHEDALTPQEVEKLFCAAVLQEGPEVTQRVTGRFIDYRGRSDQVLAELAGTIPRM